MSWISRRWAGWFDGVDDYVVVPAWAEDGQDLTIIAIIRPLEITGSEAWAPVFSSYWGGWGFQLFNNHIDAKAVVDGVEKPVRLFTGTDFWGNTLFLAETVDYDPATNTTTLKGYLNGEYKGKTTATGVPDRLSSRAWKMAIYGAGKMRAKYYMILAYNRALSDEEIQQIYNDPFDPNNVPKDGLVGWWDFNKADWSNGILPDLSGNGNDGQIIGVVQRDVLVKRGKGELPKWDLKYEWINHDGRSYYFGDGSVVRGEFIQRCAGIFAWVRNFQDDNKNFGLSSINSTIGYWDSDEGGWYVPANSSGVLADFEFGMLGSNVLRLQLEAKVVDNSLTDKFASIEVYDKRTGEFITSMDYYVNNFPTVRYGAKYGKYTVYANEGKYRAILRVYPVATDIWIRSYGVLHYHALIFRTKGYRLYDRYKTNNVDFTVWLDDGSIIEKSASYGESTDWLLVGGQYDGRNGEMDIFANGSKIATYTGLSVGTVDMSVGYSEIFMSDYGGGVLSNSFIGSFASLMVFDRLLSDAEALDLYDRKFILDGLMHWFVVDENGNLVDLVTGKSYQIQGDPVIREIYDEEGRLNGGTGVVVFDIIKDERGQ